MKDIEEGYFTEPVIIIEEQRGIFPAVKVQKFLQLFLHALDIMHDRFNRDEVTFLAFAGRVAD